MMHLIDLHLIDDITWNFFSDDTFFLQHYIYIYIYIEHDTLSLAFPYVFFLPPSTSSGLTFHRFALSSVTFIVYGVDDEVADDEGLLRRTAFVRAGWPPVLEWMSY